jgi:hypothetical protein
MKGDDRVPMDEGPDGQAAVASAGLGAVAAARLMTAAAGGASAAWL